jgi:hypothetical protein
LHQTCALASVEPGLEHSDGLFWHGDWPGHWPGVARKPTLPPAAACARGPHPNCRRCRPNGATVFLAAEGSGLVNGLNPYDFGGITNSL